MALGIQPGDEVITTPFSFFATAEVILLCQAKPVFVDIDPCTYNLDPYLLEAAITPRTKAIMPVSLYGQCADMAVINTIAARHQLPVIEDAAQSFGASYGHKRSGALSTIGCTSFFPSKPLGGYGDSGACFTDDDQLAHLLRDIRVHGQKQRYLHYTLGITGRMDTLQAAILLEKLSYFEEELALRQKVVQRYHALLADLVKTPTILPDHVSAFAQYTIEVPHREALQQALQAQGIPTAIHYAMGMHEQPLLKHLGYQRGDFPCTEYASQHVLSLPMHPYLREAEQQFIVQAIQQALQKQPAAIAL